MGIRDSWTAGGTLLASATVGAGTGAPLMGFWRTVSLASAVALTSGMQYVVGASLYGGSERWGFANIGNVSFDSRISFDDGRIVVGGFQFPSLVQATCDPPDAPFWCFGGGNVVLADAVPVPEPGPVMLIATGLLGLVLVGVRRRRQDLANEA